MKNKMKEYSFFNYRLILSINNFRFLNLYLGLKCVKISVQIWRFNLYLAKLKGE